MIKFDDLLAGICLYFEWAPLIYLLVLHYRVISGKYAACPHYVFVGFIFLKSVFWGSKMLIQNHFKRLFFSNPILLRFITTVRPEFGDPNLEFESRSILIRWTICLLRGWQAPNLKKAMLVETIPQDMIEPKRILEISSFANANA